jgi:hypothetical protein
MRRSYDRIIDTQDQGCKTSGTINVYSRDIRDSSIFRSTRVMLRAARPIPSVMHG